MFGTLTTLDTLAATQSSIAQYDEDRAWDQVRVALEAHNRDLDEVVGSLVEFTGDRQRRYGSAASKNMQELDQFGRAEAQKITAGVTVGFPMRLYGDALQWTRKFIQTPGSAAQLAAELTAIMDADRRNRIYQIKRALFTPTNYNFDDILVDNVTLAVKRLVNADSAAIPLGPNGESFNAATHTHYLFTAGVAPVASDLTALVSTVLEHYNTGTIMVYVNRAQEAVIRTLTGFVPVIASYIERGGGATTDVGTGALDMLNPNNRFIGYYDAAQVWVKPWVPAGWMLAVVDDARFRPLVMRDRGQRALQLVADDENHPLRARQYEAEFGVAVWNRTAAAVMYIDTGNGDAYVAPTAAQLAA